MKIAVIPARGGSKRVPRKNIRDFCGRPMLGWSIEAAQRSGCFDRIILSTDDAEIAATGRALGADVPFVRPAALADDHAGTIPVIAHAVEWLRAEGAAPALVCCIYATAPFVQAEDLQRGEAAMADPTVDYAFSVTSFGFPIQRALRIGADGRVGMFHPEHAGTRSQDLEDAWHDAGQFYWGRADAWAGHTPLFGPGSVPVILPRWRVQDIDTEEDWRRAEWMFRAIRETA